LNLNRPKIEEVFLKDRQDARNLLLKKLFKDVKSRVERLPGTERVRQTL
jgi:hypothetical protein